MRSHSENPVSLIISTSSKFPISSRPSPSNLEYTWYRNCVLLFSWAELELGHVSLKTQWNQITFLGHQVFLLSQIQCLYMALKTPYQIHFC